MFLYRLCQRRHADLTGKGGLYASGRWHRKGTEIIYTSENRSLAILENLVHINDRGLLPNNYVLMTVQLKDNISFEKHTMDALTAFKGSALLVDNETLLSAIGTRWNEDYSYTQDLLMPWINSKGIVAVKVPSSMVPEEYNILLNPSFDKFKDSCSIFKIEEFEFDNRLLP